jgi:IS30 family transposase
LYKHLLRGGKRWGCRNAHPLLFLGTDYTDTITADNGKEFAKHQEIAEKLEVSFYFYKPFHSWERGANENMNGLIRQYIPKGTDFSEITDEFVAWVENKLNNRPRKRLGYLTPNEKFNLLLTG